MRELDRSHPYLRGLAERLASTATGSGGTVGSLRGRTLQATDVHLALWDDEAKDWYLRTGDGPDQVEDRLTVVEAARRGILPISAFPYAERTSQRQGVPQDAWGASRG